MPESEKQTPTLVTLAPALLRETLRARLTAALAQIEDCLLYARMGIDPKGDAPSIDPRVLLKLAIETTTSEFPPPVIDNGPLAVYVQLVIAPLLPKELLGAMYDVASGELLSVCRDFLGGVNTAEYYKKPGNGSE